MTRSLRIDDLTELAVPEQPALAPDRTQVAYVLRTTDAKADKTLRNLWRVPASGGTPQQLTRGDADMAPVWSPDGSQLAFLRAKDGPAQVWVLPASGGEPMQLTKLPLGAGTPTWSPDGKRIAFAAPVDIAPVEKGETAPIVTERLDYQADGAGWLRTIRNHVHIIDVADQKVRQATEGDWHAGDPAWSPDGLQLAFGAATAPDADLAPTAPAYVLDATDPKAKPQLAGLAEGLAGPMSWTADGKALLIVGQPAGPVGHAGLLRLTLDGGEVTNLAAPLDRNVMAGGPGYPGAVPALIDDDRSVLFAVRDRGYSHLYSVPVAGGTPQHVLGAAGELVSGLSVAGGVAVVVLSTPTSFGEIVTVDLATGASSRLTSYGDEELEQFVRVEREFTISDGTVVAGWLMRDPAAEEPQPLLLDIHGGPHNAWTGAADEVHLYHQELVARGWTVLLLNPRGSDGYGEKFFNAALGHWGTADAADFLEPLDELVAEGIADPDRLAVAGYSYGGFMTCYLTSRSDRFAAAVTGGVVSDLTSMAGTSDMGHFLDVYELNGTDDYSAMSPYAEVSQVATPTLILQGDADVRCPVGQAQQWHTALRENGVPTRLVLYPDASHLFILDGRPSHRLDFNRRILDWVEQYAGDARGTRRARIDAAHWQRRLTTLAERHGVPGATLGILRVRPGADDELVSAATGVLNKNTGVAVTADSLFQIGSMSKVWTATLALQLVDEGLLDLDAPISQVLPELQLGDPDVAKQVTMRHLLTHTSGIDGDVFTDTGRGDDCLEKYTELLAEVAQNHPLGATWSYCNSGFVLAGRVIEKLTGGTWDKALRDRLITPLGLKHTVTLPEEALLHLAAVGHVGEGEPEVAPVWGLPRSVGPAGLITSTAADALAFARLHLNGGKAPDGTQLLSAESVTAMAAQHAELPDKYSLGDSWGLGWIRFGWNGRRLIGHDGNTIGQGAFLRVLPDEGLAVTLLTNGGNARDLYEDLYREIFASLADVEMPAPLEPPAEPVEVDARRHVGRYERASVQEEVFMDDDGPVLRTTITGPLAELLPEPTQEHRLIPVDTSGDLYVTRQPGSLTWSPVTFYSLPTGEKYLHTGVRATPKVGG
ncbi:serine hydrolase [Kribbella sp. NPDC026611]|uniref:serine hydrolase n=1 Tax=Kribbella sp. NPDC026611 TaxID=3154911 RepID=UPI0033FAFDCF